MPIKQIQLRGISRVPSDRASADGGCAESLNVHLEQGETAPTIPPKDISTSIFGENTRSRIKFVHKMRGITNYIGVRHDSTNHNYKFAAYGTSLAGGMDNMGNAVTVNDDAEPGMFSSVGNTLVAYAAGRPYYFLFKDGAYVYLGSSIPKPMIEISSLKTDNRYASANIEGDYLKETDDSDDWNAAATPGDEHYTDLITTMNNVWDSIKIGIGEARAAGIFVAPFFIRYALRLYDGSYIYTSSPFLCGASESQNWVRTLLSQSTDQIMATTFHNCFRVYLHGSLLTGNWSDIVKSIDFFASTPVYAPAMEAGYLYMTQQGEVIYNKMGDSERDATIREEVVSKGQFYKIKSIELTDSVEMAKLSAGTLRLDNADNISGDTLLTQDNMPDGYRDGEQYVPVAGVQNFNSRLMLIGATETLSRGDMFLNGQMATGDWENSLSGRSSFVLRFKIVDSATGLSHYVLANYYNNSNDIYVSYFNKVDTSVGLQYGNVSGSTGQFKKSDAYAWICYPDTRCTQVEVYCSANVQGKVIPMEPHPYLNCSFAFLGLGVALRNPGSQYANISKPSSYTEDRVINADNKLMLSEFENPFLFPAGNIITFPDKLIGAATTSVPLSEGQLGDYNMYVFTEGGIKVLIPTAEGTFAATMAHPNLTRHVALPGTILGIEQAVLFITERGVMLLSGNAVTELSREMNGTPFVLNGASGSSLYAIRQSLVNNATWQPLLGATIDSDTFMAFMRSAKPAYDFNGARFIFFSTSKQYQYEYRLETRTWHKFRASVINPDILNSYPDCLVSWSPNVTPTVLNFSTILNDASILSDTPGTSGAEPQPTPGIIVTRPFDLGEPDIRKAIRDIRVRGRFNRNDVQYILLGSFDNISWNWVKTLHGGSYKFYRMIILANLMAMERITWIDVEYDSRFTNRLR